MSNPMIEEVNAFNDLTTLNPRAEYHDDMGVVLWWWVKDGAIHGKPYCGTLHDVGVPAEIEIRMVLQGSLQKSVYSLFVDSFPNQMTHFSALPQAKHILIREAKPKENQDAG